jgi:molecular chaperone DnaK (HSP70)
LWLLWSAYGIDKVIAKPKNTLVFDLGGGSLSVSAVIIDEGVHEVLATGGHAKLGGRDFTAVLMKYFLQVL